MAAATRELPVDDQSVPTADVAGVHTETTSKV
jgi:hypothetical protein